MDHESDNNIIARVLNGETEAFERIVQDNKALVFRIVQKYVPEDGVEDTAQETFIKCYKSLPGFRQESDFSHWLSKIAVRTCYDYWRKHRKTKEIHLTSEHFDLLDEGNSMKVYSENETLMKSREVLDWAMNKLKAEDKMIVSLLYLEGHEEKSAAEIMGWSLSKVKGRAFKSRNILRNTLQSLFRSKKYEN